MNFLTLDSSSQRLMVAVKAKSKEAGVILNSVGKHGAFLITAMQDLLTYVGLNPSELDFVGCGIGPGSLTGLRVGISTIKGFAFPFNLSVAVFCSLDVLAIASLNVEEKGVVIRRGREGHYYWRRYRLTSDELIQETSPAFSPLEELKKELNSDEIVVFEDHDYSLDLPGMSMRLAKPPAIEDLLRLTEKSYEKREFVNLRELAPYYLQKSVAEINWEKRHGSKKSP